LEVYHIINFMSRPKILVIAGPTASGKTALSIKLAKKFGGEIVSADSRQIYRGMDIGTAKPSKKEMAGILHYLIDIKDPNEDYTVADYKKDAIAAIKKILKKKKLPILIGGTGLYVNAVIYNLDIPSVPPDQKLRNELEEKLQKHGLQKLFEELIKLDPEAAYIVDPKNPRRVIRALEVAIKTGKTFSGLRKKGKPLFDVLEIGIYPGKERLAGRINKRVDEMAEAGLLEEVKNLVKKYPSASSGQFPSASLGTGGAPKSFDAIGYREIVECLHEKKSFEEAAELIKRNTQNYAKRQMTWFRKNKEIRWIKNKKQAFTDVKKFLKK